MSIKHLIDPKLAEKWKKEEEELLLPFTFNVGDLVSRIDSRGESLGIFLDQDGIWATVRWTKTPEGTRFSEQQMVADIITISGEQK